MSKNLQASGNQTELTRINLEQIKEIARYNYGRVSPRLKELTIDITSLYDGNWPTHEACQVRYHNLGHSVDVALALARMISGWNKVCAEKDRIAEDVFLDGQAAAFFHDAGYIKDKGDADGYGGKYTLSHVDRSMYMAGKYLEANNWPENSIAVVPRMISPTDYNNNLDFESIPISRQEKIVARMLVSADLVAQMADVDYMRRIRFLFEEFQESYQHESPEVLREKGVRVFKNVEEIVEGTRNFYEEFVMPRLQELGRMDKYLVAYFGDGRNPYLENIAANLSGQLYGQRIQWQRLGEVLEALGIVSHDQIKYAIGKQNQSEEANSNSELSHSAEVSKKLLARMNERYSTELIGEILMEMDAINPVSLCQGLLSQVLPPIILDSLSRNELIYLLNVSMLLHNYQKGSRVFSHILEMTNDLLECEASSILLADYETEEIVIALPTGPRREELEGKRFSMDKGLAGWVYTHHKPVSVNNVKLDDRFFEYIDNSGSFQTRSILAVPLHINGEWIGVIEVLNKKDDCFTEHDMDILTSLVNIISSALGSTLSNHYSVDQ
jgi:hypothetical protein